MTLKRAAEVYLDDAREGVERVGSVLAEHFFREHDAGRIDDPAERAELRHNLQPAAHARLVGYVDARESRAAAELGHEPRTRRFVDIGNRHARARLDEHPRRRFAQSRSAAGDEENAVLELQGLEKHYRLTVWAFSAVSIARRTAS